jgi:hypothetical protein
VLANAHGTGVRSELQSSKVRRHLPLHHGLTVISISYEVRFKSLLASSLFDDLKVSPCLTSSLTPDRRA